MKVLQKGFTLVEIAIVLAILISYLVKTNRAGEVAPRVGADFVTQSHVELIKRPEGTAAIIAKP